MDSFDFVSSVRLTFLSIVDFIDLFYADFLIDVEENEEMLKFVVYESTRGQLIFVFNRNLFRKEIWLSSPISGPYHFKYDHASCVWKSKSTEMFSLFYSELDVLLNLDTYNEKILPMRNFDKS